MKVLKVLSLIALFVFSAPSVWGQQTEVSVRKMVKLNPKSVVQEISVEVEPNTNGLQLNINCRLDYGKVILELYDPKGKRRGKLSLGGSSTQQNPQEEEGKLESSFYDPLAGAWIIKVTPTLASGSVSLNFKSVNVEQGAK